MKSFNLIVAVKTEARQQPKCQQHPFDLRLWQIQQLYYR